MTCYEKRMSRRIFVLPAARLLVACLCLAVLVVPGTPGSARAGAAEILSVTPVDILEKIRDAADVKPVEGPVRLVVPRNGIAAEVQNAVGQSEATTPEAIP